MHIIRRTLEVLVYHSQVLAVWRCHKTGQGKNSVEFALHGQVFSRYIRSGPRTADTQTETQTLDCREKFGRHSKKGRKQAQGMGYGVLTLNRGISGMCKQSKPQQQKEDAQLRRMGEIIKSASSWRLLDIPSLLGCSQGLAGWSRCTRASKTAGGLSKGG